MTLPPERGAERISARSLLLITAGLALLFAAMTAPRYLFGGDSARYVAAARSLAHGTGYRLFDQPESLYAPGRVPGAVLYEFH